MLLPYLQTFAAAPGGCAKPFLGLTSWFSYFPNSWFGPISAQPTLSKCDINSNFSFLPSDGHSGLLLIGLAVVDDLIRIAALVAVGYVVYGGIQYVTSQGSPDSTKKAQQTIVNALIGVAVAVIAAAFVSFIGNQLGG
jgi:hypothetical protein